MGGHMTNGTMDVVLRKGWGRLPSCLNMTFAANPYTTYRGTDITGDAMKWVVCEDTNDFVDWQMSYCADQDTMQMTTFDGDSGLHSSVSLVRSPCTTWSATATVTKMLREPTVVQMVV